MGTSGWITLGVVAVVIIGAIIIYNRLVALRNRFKNAFAQIDVQLQRRYDLIPNLVETAKAYLSHEKETLTRVMEARNQAASAARSAAQAPEDGSRIQKLGKAEGFLQGSLANFYAVAENYPDLKANQTLSELMEELSSTENRVGFARQAYNDAVMHYHTAREQFPNNLIAGFFGFRETELFEIENPEAKSAVKVSFS